MSILNLIHHQPDNDKIYLYTKVPENQIINLLISKRKFVGLKHFKNKEALLQYSKEQNDARTKY